jgi:hypothetical protein
VQLDLSVFENFVLIQRSKATAAQPVPDLVEVFVDGRPIQVPAGSTLLQVTNPLSEAGKSFPMWSRFYLLWEGSYDYSEQTNFLSSFLRYRKTMY